jgi:hypothetical protein
MNGAASAGVLAEVAFAPGTSLTSRRGHVSNYRQSLTAREHSHPPSLDNSRRTPQAALNQRPRVRCQALLSHLGTEDSRGMMRAETCRLGLMVAWRAPASIPLGTVGHTGSKLGTRRNSTSITGAEARQRSVARVGHRRAGVARSPRADRDRAPNMASSMLRRGRRCAG